MRDDEPTNEDLKDATRDFWRLTRTRAEQMGDVDAAMTLLDSALSSLLGDYPLEPDVRAYLIRAMEEIKAGMPAAKALILGREGGRPGNLNLDRDVALAAAVVLKKRRNPAMSDSHASKMVAMDFARRKAKGKYQKRGSLNNSPLSNHDRLQHERIVRNAYKELKGTFETHDDDYLIQIAYSKLPPAA